MEEEKKKFKIITPEEAWEKFSNWFDTRKKLAFLITFFVAIITHLTMLTETIMSQDGLWNSMQYFRPGDWEMTLGRWGIALVERLNNFIAIPTVATMSCLFVMAVSAVFIVDIFDLKSKISVILTSLIIAVTPTLTVTLLYIYTSFAYCFNFLISILVIWFLYKFKYKKTGFVLSSFCFMLSLSIYQSYIGVSIGLCVMVSILDLIKNNKKIKEVFLDILKAISAVIVGGILYFVATYLILNVLGLEFATSYKGTQGISFLSSLTALPVTLVQAYKDFFDFFLKDTIVFNTNFRREVMFMILGLGFIISTIMTFINLKEENKKIKAIKIILAVLFILVLPVCLNIVDILIIGNVMYPLTTVQMILMIPFAFAIFEGINKLSIVKWISIIACLGIILTYYIADNTSYSAIKLTYNQAYSTTLRIMDRMENTEGYYEGYQVLFGGIIGDYNFPRRSSLYTYTVGSVVSNPAFHGSYNGSIGTWVSFIRVFLGRDIAPCTPETYKRIVESKEYQDMGIFPAPDSVKIIDETVVVKLTNNPDMP